MAPYLRPPIVVATCHTANHANGFWLSTNGARRHAKAFDAAADYLSAIVNSVVPEKRRDTMNDTNTPAALTADDISAMRQATTILVRMRGDKAAEVTLQKESAGRASGPFGRDEKTLERFVVCQSNGAVAWFHISTYRDTFKVFASTLRPGDTLTLCAVDNSNQYLEMAECPHGKLDSGSYSRLHADELTATVRRTVNGKTKTIVESMLLAYSVCPDNSARAIQQPGGRY